MTKNHYRQLQDLIQGQNFEAMQAHFLKHFVQSPDLDKQLRPASDEQKCLLEGLLMAAVAHITGGDSPDPGSLGMHCLPQLGLVMGDFRWEGVSGTFFFCEKVAIGMAWLPDHNGKPGYGRFKLKPLQRPPIFTMSSAFSAHPLLMA